MSKKNLHIISLLKKKGYLKDPKTLDVLKSRYENAKSEFEKEIAETSKENLKGVISKLQ